MHLKLASPIPEIEAVRFAPIPKLLAVEGKILRDNSITIIHAKDGTLYTNLRPGFYGFGEWYFTKTLLNAMVKFKFITKAQRSEHLNAVKRRGERNSKRSAAEGMLSSAARAGIKLTKAQLRAIEKAGVDLNQKFA